MIRLPLPTVLAATCVGAVIGVLIGNWIAPASAGRNASVCGPVAPGVCFSAVVSASEFPANDLPQLVADAN